MKTFKLGLIIVLAATGSAIASMNYVQNAWVLVKFYGITSYVCIQTNLQCDESSSSLCSVNIPDLGRTTPAYKSGCVERLTRSGAAPIGNYDPAVVIIDAD